MLGRVTDLGDGCSIGGVVLAAFATHAVGRDELGCHQAHRVAELCELARPLVTATASLHGDQARRQIGNEFK